MAELPETARQKLKHWVAGPHPDTNLLAAFAENSLSARERGALMEHLAACAACREVVALAAPRDVPAPVAPAPERTVRQWAMLRWGTAAAILVVMVGVVWIGRTTKTAGPKPAAEVARATPESANQIAPEEKAKAPETARAAESIASAPERREAANARSVEPARPRAGKKEMESDRLEAVGRQKGLKDQVAANAPLAAELAPAAPAAAKAKPMSELPSLARTAPGSPAAALDRMEPKTLGAANEQAQAAVPVAPAVGAAMQAGAMAKIRAITRWSISSDGSLQRSQDEGRSWQQELAESGTVFRAVSATGSEIWAGGNRGVLYHSGDGGGSWTRVTPAAGGAALTGDIVRINFADARRGSLTTSTGQTWLTTDGGHTWALR